MGKSFFFLFCQVILAMFLAKIHCLCYSSFDNQLASQLATHARMYEYVRMYAER